MSLIHEALKKAEQQRQLGEPPTLASPFGVTRQKRSALPVIVPLIGVALVAAWWFSRPAPVVPVSVADSTGQTAPRAAAANRVAASSAPAVAEPADSSAAERRPNASRIPTDTVPAMNAPAGMVPPRNPPLPRGAQPSAKTPSVKDVAERESEPHPAGANPLAPGESAAQMLSAKAAPDAAINNPQDVADKSASKRAQGELPVVVPSATPLPTAKPASSAPVSAASAPNAAKTAEAASATKSQSDNAGKPAIAGIPPATPAAAATKVASATTTSGATLANPALAGDHTPLYWELPLNVRKDLPVLKLTMHVYSSEPAQRFVVLNGNRQVEGDDLGAEVKLSEIRADGVVLEFHGQRFLVPRGGS
ncbi:MAG: general secretion pathway protein GspB [Tahibacter sp.]